MVLTELVQNAVEHGQPGLTEIVVGARRDAEVLRVRVDDDGAGLPPDFDLDESSSLGLTIVRTLVESELGGQLTVGAGPGGRGTRAEIDVRLG
jgi:two-component sensor histidine kinase